MNNHNKLRKLVPKPHRLFERLNGCGSTAGFIVRCPITDTISYNSLNWGTCMNCKNTMDPIRVDKEKDL